MHVFVLMSCKAQSYNKLKIPLYHTAIKGEVNSK